jgi:hypothetical protein
MKLLDSHTTTKHTRRRHKDAVLKRGTFAGLRKRQGRSLRVCWAGNRFVKESGQVSESQASDGRIREQREARTLGWRLVTALRGHTSAL